MNGLSCADLCPHRRISRSATRSVQPRTAHEASCPYTARHDLPCLPKTAQFARGLPVFKHFSRNLKQKPNIKFNPFTPNVNHSCRTAPLTSKVAFYIFIQQI
jgi:hypothetical protein